MLDFLLILGQVPGTGFYVTFTEIVLVLIALTIRYLEKKYRKQIRRWLKWARYRIGVNYRRRKRQLKTFIKQRRYRMAVAKRRSIRETKRYLRGEKKAFALCIHRAIRQMKLEVRRTIRSNQRSIDRNYRLVKRTVRLLMRKTYKATVIAGQLAYRRRLRRTKMLTRQAYRNLEANNYRRYRRMYKKFAKFEKRFKSSRAGGIYAVLSTSFGHSTRN